jgi:hypothetical protein
MPGVGRLRGVADGGQLKGGAPRVVWQTLGADPRTVSARSAAQRLEQDAGASHLVWNPVRGEIVQLIPILRAGRLLGWPEDLSQMTPSWANAGATSTPGHLAIAEPMAGGPTPPGAAASGTAADEIAGVNSEGRICVQICVVGFAWTPFTARPMTGLQQILDWLDSWDIPRQWPAGPPAPFPHGRTTRGNRRLWAQGGHFGASQVPDLSAAGPGAVDIEQLTGRAGQPPRVGQPERARSEAAPVPARSRPGRETQPAAAGMRDLDEYFDHDEAETAGALSRVG